MQSQAYPEIEVFTDPVAELDCQKGRVRIVKDSATIGFYNGKELKAMPKSSEYIDYGQNHKDYWGYCHCIQIKEFYQALKRGDEPQINGQEGVKTQQLVWNIYKSARLNKRIKM